MKRLLPAFLAALLAALPAAAQGIASPGEMGQDENPAPSEAPARSTPAPARAGRSGSAELQAAVDRLTRANADLLDLLKRQQAVLEDIQYDRRLQGRQISLIEQRLEDTLAENAALQAQVSKLKAQQEPGPAEKPEEKPDDNAAATAAAALTTTPAAEAAPPAPPASFLPSAPEELPPGTMGWHRVLSLSGDETQNSDTFRISGSHWRVYWHNQDKPGDTYRNTSALFISAFPKNDSIPKKICSQLGTGGDTTDLKGAGEYYLKVEASGGHWELAVEDFR